MLSQSVNSYISICKIPVLKLGHSHARPLFMKKADRLNHKVEMNGDKLTLLIHGSMG